MEADDASDFQSVTQTKTVITTATATLDSLDIAKSPHMARIGGSVYKDVDARSFYMDRQGNPSEMMEKSLVFNLVNYRYVGTSAWLACHPSASRQ